MSRPNYRTSDSFPGASVVKDNGKDTEMVNRKRNDTEIMAKTFNWETVSVVPDRSCWKKRKDVVSRSVGRTTRGIHTLSGTGDIDRETDIVSYKRGGEFKIGHGYTVYPYPDGEMETEIEKHERSKEENGR